MKIKEIIGCDNRGAYALVHVILDDGTEATAIVGGSVETYFHKGQVRVFVKRNLPTAKAAGED